MEQNDDLRGKQPQFALSSNTVMWVFLAVIGYFLVTEHWAHIVPYLPYLILLLCPLLHIFHHKGHGGHEHHHGEDGKG